MVDERDDIASNGAIMQHIKLEVGRAPPRVLKQSPFKRQAATIVMAREMLLISLRDASGTEAVRFVDHSGKEICRYTVLMYLQEQESF